MGTRRALAMLACGLAAGAIAPAAAQAENSLALALSADPTEEKPVTVTVSVSSDTPQRLQVFRELGGGDCASTPQAHESRGAVLEGSADEVQGQTELPFTFTPSRAGAHRICAFLGTSAPVIETTVANVRVASGSLTIDVPASGEEAQPVVLTVAGSTEVSRSLFVYRELGGADCGATAAAHANERMRVRSVGVATVGPGGIEQSFSFTPPETGAHRICAFLTENADAAPVAVATAVHSARCAAPCDGEDGQPPVLPDLSHLPAATLFAPAAGLDTTNRKLSFLWQGAEGLVDDLVVVDDINELVLVARRDGVLIPTDPDESDVENLDEYYGGGSSPTGDAVEGFQELPTSAKFNVRRLKAAGKVVADGERWRFTPTQGIVPGAYRWFVERSKDGRVASRSESRRFRVRGPRLRRLRVSARRSPGPTTGFPGVTTLRVTTSPFAAVKLVVRRAGKSRTLRYAWGASATSGIKVDWSCDDRGSDRYSYTITARDSFGKRITRRGRFRTISAAECMRRRQRDFLNVKEPVLRRIAQQRNSAARRKADRAFESKDARCRARYGETRAIIEGGDQWLLCRGPLGALLPI